MSDGSAARQDEESGEAADALERQFGLDTSAAGWYLDASAAGSLDASAIDANASWADLVDGEVDGPLFGASDRQDERSPVPAGAAARAPALRPVARVVTHSRPPRAMSAPPPENALLAVPKKGRLNDDCKKLLAGAGIDYKRVRQTALPVGLHTSAENDA